MDPPIAQAKLTPKLGNKTGKKAEKKKPFHKEMKEIRGPDHTDQQAKVSIASAWSKPLHIIKAPQPSEKNVLTKMPIHQSAQQRVQRMDPPIAQAKPVPNLGKKTGKKAEKKKPFYKEVRKEIRGPAYWKEKAEQDRGLLQRAQGIWRGEVRRKAAEYRRRRMAKKSKGKSRVSHKWMMKKENRNRRAHRKKQAKREVFVKLNQVYKAKFRVEWMIEINEELVKSRIRQAIFKNVGAKESYPTNGRKEARGSISEARPTRKEAEKIRKANEKRLNVRLVVMVHVSLGANKQFSRTQVEGMDHLQMDPRKQRIFPRPVRRRRRRRNSAEQMEKS
ncbi:hypothetical protein EDB19DRAFT_577808 [Suillus lakei]|nr:hypothetical protein EDB19DRAFT_577808 [Suillus lakei]